jgi:hypothetical protein
MLCKGMHWTAQQLAVVLLIYAHPFLSVLLVVQFEGCTLGCKKKLIRGIAREAPESIKLVPVEELDVFQFELYHSF